MAKVKVASNGESVVDLTKSEGVISNVAASSIQLSNIPFLKEVWVSNSMKFCILTHEGSIVYDKTYYFETGVIKLPAGIQYVADYVNWIPRPEKTTNPIFSNILLNLTDIKPKEKKPFHICSTRTGGILDRTNQGCSLFMKPYNGSSTAYENPHFAALYFEGSLYFSDDKNAENGSWYLIPMVESEKSVTYFVIKKDTEGTKHIEILNEMKRQLDENPKLGEDLGIYERYQLNDKPGIRITRAIGADDPLRRFPFNYDPETLERVV